MVVWLWLNSVISYQLSVISYQLSVISYQLSVISYQLSVISYQLSVIIVFALERTNQLSLLPDKDLVDLCPPIEPYQVTKNLKF